MQRLRPLTVLMTADTIGGVWTYALELTRALQSFGIEVHLATMGRKLSRSQWDEAKQLSNVIIYESDYALEWMEDPWGEVEDAGKWLLSLEQQIQPDLIHLNNYVHGALDWKAPVLIVGHSCVLSWWKSVKKEEAPSHWNTYAAKVKEGLQKADYVIGVTQQMLHCLQQYYGPFSFSKVIYNSREKNGFRPSLKEPLIFSMGRLWDEAKNIQALGTISDQLDWPVYVAGEDNGQLQTHWKNLTFLGKLGAEEVVGWLGRTSIYVMPARYEPFGLSILEAALSGCALVLGDIPSLREVWGDAALYADPDDRDTLKTQLQHLIHHPAMRQEMADRAMRRTAQFSLESMGQQYMVAYQQLLKIKQIY